MLLAQQCCFSLLRCRKEKEERVERKRGAKEEARDKEPGKGAVSGRKKQEEIEKKIERTRMRKKEDENERKAHEQPTVLGHGRTRKAGQIIGQ